MRIFEQELSRTLSPKNKLYKLRSLINWESLEKYLITNINTKKLGRDRKSHRVMVGLLMLQAMNNTSDSLTSEELSENAYWQYFCSYEYFDKDVSISESTILRFRRLLGTDGMKEIMKELLNIGIKVGAVLKKRFGICDY